MHQCIIIRIFWAPILTFIALTAESQPLTETGQPPMANPAIASIRKTLGTQGLSVRHNCIDMANNQDIILGGYHNNTADKGYPLLSSFTQGGDQNWSLKFGPGDDINAQVSAVTAIHSATNGDILTAGYVNTDKSKAIQYPYEDAFVARVSTAGEIKWLMTYDRNKMECVRENLFRPFLISEGARNEIIVAAEMFNCISETQTLVVLKLDPSGNVIWSSSYEYPLSLTYRSGMSIDGTGISFWGTRAVANQNGQNYLDHLQFDYKNGNMISRRSWELISNPNDPDNTFGGNIFRTQKMNNGNILVYGTTTKAFDNFNSRRAHFTILEFNAAYQFIQGYNIVPVTKEISTIQLNITSDKNGMVLFNRLYKKTSTSYSYALGTAANRAMIHERVFENAQSNLVTPEPLHFSADNSFSFLNMYGSVIDFYTLNNDDVNTGCLGNTNPGEVLFETEPVQYRPLPVALPPINLDTIIATDNGFHAELVNMQNGNRLDLGIDLIICEGSSINISAPAGFSSYVWNNGYRGATLVTRNPGLYYCTVTDYCGLRFTDSIMVVDNGSVQLIKAEEVSVCKDERLEVNAEQGYVRYRWGPEYNLVNNPASPTLIAKPAKDTVYFVQAENNTGCFIYDTVRIKVKQALSFSLGPDKSICPGDSILLSASGIFQTYLWSDGTRSEDFRVKKSGQYSLTGFTADGCRSSDTVMITQKDCGTAFFMPNAFTPNGDGLNDLIKPITKGNLVQYQMLIYNRWGQLVFSSADISLGWDGKFKGIIQGPQTYTWQCVWQVEGGELKRNYGSLTLIR